MHKMSTQYQQQSK